MSFSSDKYAVFLPEPNLIAQGLPTQKSASYCMPAARIPELAEKYSAGGPRKPEKRAGKHVLCANLRKCKELNQSPGAYL